PYRLLTLFYFTYSTTPVIYTLSLHDALPISPGSMVWREYGGYAAWSDEVATATMIVHRLDILAWQKANEGRTNKLKQPEPIEPPRPRAEIEAENARMERQALRFLEQQRKRAASS